MINTGGIKPCFVLQTGEGIRISFYEGEGENREKVGFLKECLKFLLTPSTSGSKYGGEEYVDVYFIFFT